MEVSLIGISYEYLSDFPTHKHSNWELVLFLKGTGIHRVGGKEINFKPGMLVYQPPPDIGHSTAADDTYQDLYIQIKNFIPPVRDSVSVFADDEENSFLTIAKLMHTTFHRKEVNYKTILSSLMYAMYQMMLCRDVRDKKSDNIKAAVREIITNYSDPRFSTQKLVNSSNYCSDHFRRKFKKETGVTPAAYLIEMRINHSMKHLKQRNETGLSIRDIALISGFNDPYYFSKLFKNKTGINPASY